MLMRTVALMEPDSVHILFHGSVHLILATSDRLSALPRVTQLGRAGAEVEWPGG